SAAGGEIFDFVSARESTDAIAGGPAFSSFTDKTVTIRGSNGRTYTQGVDFDIVPDVAGKATVRWRTESGYIAPPPGAAYTIDAQSSNGTVTTYNGTARSAIDQPQFNGTVSGGGTVAINNGGYTGVTASISSGGSLLLDWSGTANGPITPNPNVPQWTGNTNDVYTVEYTYNTNTFVLTDDGNGLLNALGLDLTDDAHFTAAQDAVMVLDGETITRSSNTIGESSKNELIKGMTITLKGLGRVQLDVEQDAEAAVKGVQTFLTAYNDLMSWINTRMTEKAVDENTKATLDSDDFRMKWGLLKGNSLLRSTKDTLRRLTSQVYTTSTTQRKSSAPVYGPMSQNGIVNPGIITVTVGARVLSLTISPDDTLQSIADRINSKEIDGENNPLFFDPDGQEYPIPFVKAVVESNQLTIQAGTDRPVSVGGNGAILRVLGVNYAYSTLSSVGLKLASTGAMSDQGKAGTLDFDSAVFMEALEANAEDVSLLMTNFAGQMQTYMDNMLKTSQIEVASGVTTAQGALAREINAIDTEIASIDKYLTEFDRRLESKRESLFTQFSSAETNLAKLMQQANWLASVTAQLQSASS
ncbi:MAG: flagellar filament capping protein FliD, partial [Synergistaceae bacterium]|nr:flagellar filament capping protein FliD [Synergistaceae bacterium]